MIVVDSSAIVAIILAERTVRVLSQRLAEAPIGQRWLATPNYVEAGTVLAGRRLHKPESALHDLDDFLSEAGIELVAIDADVARVALAARIKFGKGFGGVLNFSDCFAYGLAKTRNAPLLYVGNDFHKTDIESAL